MASSIYPRLDAPEVDDFAQFNDPFHPVEPSAPPLPSEEQQPICPVILVPSAPEAPIRVSISYDKEAIAHYFFDELKNSKLIEGYFSAYENLSADLIYPRTAPIYSQYQDLPAEQINVSSPQYEPMYPQLTPETVAAPAKGVVSSLTSLVVSGVGKVVQVASNGVSTLLFGQQNKERSDLV